MNTLFVILGATGTGKTALSIRMAQLLKSPVISADSRQIYKEIPIGTAAPTAEQQSEVQHYFVANHQLQDYYSASRFEEDAIALITELHKTHENLLMCGGSMMYIDAVCEGIDDMPTVTTEVRNALRQQYETEGLASILAELQQKDPQHYEFVDKQNYRRVIHAVEMCRMTGKPYSELRTHTKKSRPFRIIKIGLQRERQELFERIGKRVDEMIANGLIAEAEKVYKLRDLNALNTVGYKELFAYFDGKYTLDEAIEKIKRNTRVYAKKQMTWFKRDKDIFWFDADNEEKIVEFVSSFLEK